MGDTPQDRRSGFYKRLRMSIMDDPILPRTDQERRRYLLRNLLLHFRPATIPVRTLRFSLTWGLGGMAVILIGIQIVSGMLLKFVYQPTPVSAYASVLRLINEVPFGRLIRNVHHWSAHMLVMVLVLHLMRVFFTGAFRKPRQFNWVIGLLLLVTVLGANFTGYLLPWDQLAYWAVTVATGMLEYLPLIGHGLQHLVRGGSEIGPATLQLFFALHTTLVPFCLVLLMAFHFWRIRKAGGLVNPRAPQEDLEKPLARAATWPHLLVRETVVATVLVAVLMIWSAWVDAPLAQAANPGLSPNPTKAPWYFAWLQELLMQLPPVVALTVFPGAGGLFLFSIPYWSEAPDPQGVWFGSVKGRRTALISALVGGGLMTAWVFINDAVQTGTPSVWIRTMPLAALLLTQTILVWLLKKRYALTAPEIQQALFVLLITAVAVLTASGVWLRGAGMALGHPW